MKVNAAIAPAFMTGRYGEINAYLHRSLTSWAVLEGKRKPLNLLLWESHNHEQSHHHPNPLTNMEKEVVVYNI